MAKQKKATLDVHGNSVTVLTENDQDYISLTDIARFRNVHEPFAVINNWMRTRSTIEFLGLWEKLTNPAFKPLDFERFREELSTDGRAELADLLVESLGAAQFGSIDRAWLVETKRRRDEVRSGKASSIPASEAVRKVRDALKQ